MSMEARPELPQPESESFPRTSERLLRSVELLAKTQVSKVEVSGREHLEELRPEEVPIFTTSHIQDVDIPLAVAVFGRAQTATGRTFDIAVTDQSVHHSFREEPSTNIGLRAAGKENFIPIDWKKGSGGKTPRFNPANFPPMRAAMERGKSIVIAAQNPTFTGSLGKGGVGAVYLAQLSGQPIIPFAVDMGEKEGVLQRPVANTHIGAPLRLEPIPGIAQLAALEEKRSNRTMNGEEQVTYRQLVHALKEQSQQVMQAIASMLPAEKRGIYLAE